MTKGSKRPDAGPADDPHFGRMNDPSAAAWLTGPCGDTMEFYLVVENDTLAGVRYYTDGCEYTRRCGAAVARRVNGQRLPDALSVSAREIMDTLQDLPSDHRHCAILAVSAFYRALCEYWITTARAP